MSSNRQQRRSLVTTKSGAQKGVKRTLERASVSASRAIAKKGSGANMQARHKAALEGMWAESAVRLRDGLDSTGRLQFAPPSYYAQQRALASRFADPSDDEDYLPSGGASSDGDDDDYSDANEDQRTIVRLRAELDEARAVADARGRKLAEARRSLVVQQQAPPKPPPPYAVPPFGALEMRRNPRVFPTGRHLASSAAPFRIVGPVDDPNESE